MFFKLVIYVFLVQLVLIICDHLGSLHQEEDVIQTNKKTMKQSVSLFILYFQNTLLSFNPLAHYFVLQWKMLSIVLNILISSNSYLQFVPCRPFNKLSILLLVP